jgi:hypothetical protein
MKREWIIFGLFVLVVSVVSSLMPVAYAAKCDDLSPHRF